MELQWRKQLHRGLVPSELVTQPAIIAALLAAIIWNLITWFYGIPSSSSHALIGGMLGAVIAEAGFRAPYWRSIVTKLLLPLIISPIIGFVFSLVIMIVMLRIFIKKTPGQVQGLFEKLQVVSSAFMAFSHGGNDAQKTMGIMTLAVASYLGVKDMPIPLWIKLTAAIAMGLGTAAGGWRIIKTMGHKLANLQPIHGFAAETAAAIVIETASHLGFPLSTTHVISSAILGAGASRGAKAVKWNIAGSILTAWILTIRTCMLLTYGIFLLVNAIVPVGK